MNQRQPHRVIDAQLQYSPLIDLDILRPGRVLDVRPVAVVVPERPASFAIETVHELVRGRIGGRNRRAVDPVPTVHTRSRSHRSSLVMPTALATPCLFTHQPL